MRDEPQFQFRGIWISAEVVRLLQAGEIKSLDMTLLAIIDGLTKNGEGCWASNRHLAGIVGVKERWVQLRLAHLRGKKLLRMKTVEGRRYIFIRHTQVGKKGAHGHAPGGARSCAPRSLSIERELDNKDDTTYLQLLEERDSEMADFRRVRKPKQQSKFDDACAVQLLNINRAFKRAIPIFPRKTWADDFRKLRKSLGGDEARIAAVLDWYAEHGKDEGVPTADSARAFGRLFNWLEGLSSKAARNKVEVSAEAREIAKRLQRLGWPQGSVEQLPQAVQLSLDELVIIHDARRKILEQLQTNYPKRYKSNSLFLFVSVLASRFGSPDHFVEQWFKAVHSSVANWKEWNGDLLSQAVSRRSKRLTALGKGWATAYAGEVNLWNQFAEAVGQCE